MYKCIVGAKGSMGQYAAAIPLSIWGLVINILCCKARSNFVEDVFGNKIMSKM